MVSAAARAAIGKIRATPGMAASERENSVTDPGGIRIHDAFHRERILRKSIAALLLTLTITVPAFANPAYDLGPAVGTKVPAIGMPQDETGKPRSLESVAGEKGTVLFFFRSAAW